MSRRSLPKTGTIRYLHVSVQVQAPTPGSPAMRTPRGKGSTAGRKDRQKGKSTWREGQQAQQRERLVSEGFIKEAAPKFDIPTLEDAAG